MWRYQELMKALKNSHRSVNENVLECALAIARKKNNNTLSGLTISVIYKMVAKELKELEENLNGQMGMDKFRVFPQGGAMKSHNDCNMTSEDLFQCGVCRKQLQHDNKILICRHAFHTKCIWNWLNFCNRCPMCHKFTILKDVFPPEA